MLMIHFRENEFDYSRNGNGKKQPDANPFDDHDEEWDENDNSENVLTDNGELLITPFFLHD